MQPLLSFLGVVNFLATAGVVSSVLLAAAAVIILIAVIRY